MTDEQRPKVGVGVMIFKDGKVLMGKRKSSHGEGEYAWPGGHLEFMESISECVCREVKEETGIEVTNIKFLRLLNMTNYGKHYVDIAMVADWKSGEPEVREPEKCEGWDWYDPEQLPTPLFSTIPSYFEALKTGRNYFDIESQ